ncbi:MAG: ABC transporter substrate-binding protein [Aggregatilineales bacterium]
MRSIVHRLIRLCLIDAFAAATLMFTALPQNVSAQGELPVPRNQTIFLEDTAQYLVFDSYNTLIPNGNEFASGFVQIGNEYLFLNNYATGAFEPWLAKSYEYNSDFTSLTVHLQENAKWNDGQPFTADDVVFTVQMMMSSPKLGNNALWTEFVKNVSATDAHTVKFDLTKPAPRFHYNLAADVGSALTIYPKHIWQGKDPTTFKNNPPVTTSVWKLKSALPDLKMFIWQRDDNYWDKAERFPAAQYVVYRQAPSSADTDYQDLVNNTIDHAHGLADYPSFQKAQKANPAITVGEFQDPCPRGMWINTQRYPLSLPQVRWALSYLVNRDKIASVIWSPPTTAADHPWSDWANLTTPQFMDKSILDAHKITYDPAMAAKILDGLGFKPGPDGIRVDDKGNKLSWTIITPAQVGKGEYQIAQDVADEAKAVGIDLTVKSLNQTDAFGSATETAQFDITSHWLCGAWKDPLELYQSYTSDQPIPSATNRIPGGDNWIGLKDPKLDTAVATLKKVAPDSAAAKSAYHDALDAWMTDMPAIPVIQTIYFMPWNQTYWTGWPVDGNYYTIPFTWWATFSKVPFALKPTGK